MSTIKANEFELVQLKGTDRFIVKALTIVNAGKSTERLEMKPLYRDLPYEAAIKSIVALRMSKKDITYSPREYIAAYAAEVEEMKNLITVVQESSENLFEEMDAEEVEYTDIEEPCTINTN